MANHLATITQEALLGISPFLFTMAAVALFVAGAQARGALSVDPLKPKWDRMNPISKIPQIWGWKALMELGKSFLKLGVIALVIYNVLDELVAQIPSLGQQAPSAIVSLVHSNAARMLLGAGLAYMILALTDYAFQIWQHEKQLKMSREEIKKEHKDSEGDQVMKVRRRTMARQMARRRMLLSVSEADVVVTNPTHIAVALKYDPQEFDAPVVLAMGERKVAQRIKEIAREHDVPMVENKPLARALFATATVGAPIPVELFVAVAEILAYVYKQAAMRPRGQRAWQGAEA
jgi:flagellar biosynthetic protein FlhB